MIVKIRAQFWEVGNLVSEYLRDGGVNITETRIKKDETVTLLCYQP